MKMPTIIDSRMTFEEATAGTSAPRKIIDELCLVDVRYRAFDGRLHQGQLVIHQEVKADIVEIFALIERTITHPPLTTELFWAQTGYQTMHLERPWILTLISILS